MTKPIFNFAHIEKEEFAPHNGTAVQLMYINDMYKLDNMLMFTQMCDAGYRMGRENEDYNKWNQCIFEDIDYKFYISNHDKFIDPNILYEQLYDWLYNNYRNIFYYCELSRHMNSFHYIFYFNVQRTKNNRMMCKSISNFIIHQAFESLGYKDIIEWPKVYDDCSDSFYQPCFITLNNYKINYECDGTNSEKIITDNYFSIKSVYDKLFRKSYKRAKHQSTKNDNDWETSFEFDNNNSYSGEYLNHHERYYLFKCIVGLCGIDNEEMIEKEWNNCAYQLIEGNNHTTTFYLNEPYNNNWIDWIKRNNEFCYVDKDLLKKFGYDIKFIKIEKDEDTTNKKTNRITKERVYL